MNRGYSLDITYCFEKCQKGKVESEKFLSINNSVFDAAIDFQFFTEECFKTCPYKQAHVNNKDKES